MSEPQSTLQRIGRGDRDAVRDCLDLHGGLVWSIARRFSPTETEAEDAVQEIFLDLWTSAVRFDPSVGSETTFVAMIARRRLIDRNRKRGRQPISRTLPAELVGGEATLDRVELCDEARFAREALDDLEPGQRQVLSLAIDQGLTHDEIARTTGLPLGTVKTHARRGLISLRQRLLAPREVSK